MFQNPILTIKKIITANIFFVIFIAIFSVFLIIRALPENHIDMGSAQTILAARWWARDGFIKNYFLILNAGYGKIVQYFDEPRLQYHAHGTVAGGLIGHKLYYTHYPSLYVIPIALLLKLGVGKLFLLRMVSIIASILGLIFLYSFIKLLTNKYISLIAIFYFSISPIFIKWADSLEYIPQEDMWRFLILMLSILTLNRLKSKISSFYIVKWHLMAIWVAYLLLALTSFNSTFFIFTWLIGLTAIYLYDSPHQHKIRLFMIAGAFWALAPILGFALQLVQNVAYLGWHNVWLDIFGSFISAGNRSGLGFLTRLDGLVRPLFSMTGLYNFYILIVPLGVGKFKQFIIASTTSAVFILPLIILIITLAIIKLKKITGYNEILSFPIIILLGIAPLTQTLILTFTGFRDPLGHLFAPFAGIIVGSLLYMIFLLHRKIKILTIFDKIVFVSLFVAILSLFAVQVILNTTQRFWPTYAPLANGDIAFSKAMQNITIGEKAVFMINTIDTQISEEELKTRNAIINPLPYLVNYNILEYYLDMPLLNFTGSSYLIKDLLFLKKRSKYPFTPIIASDNQDMINKLYQELSAKKLIPSTIKLAGNKYFFTIKDSKSASADNVSEQ